MKCWRTPTKQAHERRLSLVSLVNGMEPPEMPVTVNNAPDAQVVAPLPPSHTTAQQLEVTL